MEKEYTGFKDKNGRKIYVGDYVKIKSFSTEEGDSNLYTFYLKDIKIEGFKGFYYVNKGRYIDMPVRYYDNVEKIDYISEDKKF